MPSLFLLILLGFKIMHSNLSCLSKLEPHKKLGLSKVQSIRLLEVSDWVYWGCNRICVLCIIALNDQACTGIELTLRSSAKELNHRAITTWPRRPCAKWNSKGYIDRQSKNVNRGKSRKSWMSFQNSIIYSIAIA